MTATSSDAESLREAVDFAIRRAAELRTESVWISAADARAIRALLDTAQPDLQYVKLAATPAPAEEERQTLMYVEHEIAAFIHPLHWSGSHDPEPGDGSDCHLCYEDAERLIERVVHATKAAE